MCFTSNLIEPKAHNTIHVNSPDGVTDFEIKVPKLKRLTINFTSVSAESSNCKLEIYAQNLNYFRYDGDLDIVIFLEKLVNLVEAHVHIFAEGHQVRNHDNRHYGARIFRLLRALNSAKFLELSPTTKVEIAFYVLSFLFSDYIEYKPFDVVVVRVYNPVVQCFCLSFHIPKFGPIEV